MGDAPDWDRAVFSIGSRQITISDVLRAAHFRRELDSAWADVCRRTGPHDFEVDEEAAQTASEQFRSGRDLITAEETEQWLEQRGLTVDEFGDYFIRHQRRETSAAHDGWPAVPYDDAPPELHDLLRIDLILSGEFDRLAEYLAWRYSAQDASNDAPLTDWQEEMRGLEAAFEQQRAQVLTTRAREEALSFLRLTLTRIELEILELESIDAAHEALLCLREDGETMTEVAHDGGYPLRQREWWAGEVDADLQSRLLSASPGEVIGPIPNGDEFQIYRLLRKIDPHLTDETVSVQVDQHIVKSFFAELAGETYPLGSRAGEHLCLGPPTRSCGVRRFCRFLPEDRFDSVCGLFREEHLDFGEVLVRQGEWGGPALYILTAGACTGWSRKLATARKSRSQRCTRVMNSASRPFSVVGHARRRFGAAQLAVELLRPRPTRFFADARAVSGTETPRSILTARHRALHGFLYEFSNFGPRLRLHALFGNYWSSSRR